MAIEDINGHPSQRGVVAEPRTPQADDGTLVITAYAGYLSKSRPLEASICWPVMPNEVDRIEGPQKCLRLLSRLPRLIAAEDGGHLFRAGMIDRQQSIESGLGQVRLRSGDPPEQDNAFVVGYRSDRIDEFHARFLTQIADEKCANLGPAYTAESASGCLSHFGMQVIEEIAQQGNRFGPCASAPAGVRPNLRIVMPQQLHYRVDREFGSHPRGSRDGLLQTWPLNDPLGDQPNESLRRIGAADHSERIEGGRLLGHDPIGAKPSKAPAEPFENRDRGSQPAASCFSDQRDALADTGIRYRREQAVVIDGVARDDRRGGAARNISPRRAGAHAKEIELLDSRHLRIELSEISVLEN